ncbi:MAG: NUDIX domain-containing protein, partial [Verrucomicrobiia bacterium]
RRPAGVVNTHLWEFPNVEIAPSQGGSGRKSAHYFRTKSQSRLTSAATNGLVVRAAKNLGFELSNAEPLCTVKHSITRYRITLEAFRANLGGASYASSHSEKAKSETRVTRPSETIGVWKTAAQMNRLAFAAAHRKILHALVTTKHPHRVVRSSAFRRPA